jgi:hypothetical protein
LKPIAFSLTELPDRLYLPVTVKWFAVAEKERPPLNRTEAAYFTPSTVSVPLHLPSMVPASAP